MKFRGSEFQSVLAGFVTSRLRRKASSPCRGRPEPTATGGDASSAGGEDDEPESARLRGGVCEAELEESPLFCRGNPGVTDLLGMLVTEGAFVLRWVALP